MNSVGQPGAGQEAHKGRNGGGQRGGGGRGRGRDNGADGGSNKVTNHTPIQLLLTNHRQALFNPLYPCFRAHCLVRTPADLPGGDHRRAEAAEAGGAHSHQRAEAAPGGSHPSLRYRAHVTHHDRPPDNDIISQAGSRAHSSSQSPAPAPAPANPNSWAAKLSGNKPEVNRTVVCIFI